MLADFSLEQADGPALFFAAWSAGYFLSLTLLCLLAFALLSSLILPQRTLKAVARAKFGSWLVWCTITSVSLGLTYVFVVLPYEVGFGWRDGVDQLWNMASRQI